MDEINQENFQEKVHNSDKPVVVDFWGEMCQPCVELEPIFKKVSESLKDKANFYKMNIIGNQEIFAEHGVRSVPTLIIFENGTPKAEKIGVLNEEELTAWIKENI